VYAQTAAGQHMCCAMYMDIHATGDVQWVKGKIIQKFKNCGGYIPII